ncbi:MAG: class III cytochrome C family protein [Gammaproteobacteria bacterium]|nr:class III cytochrome C family protein [Gammaproteobacteria bacterium]
MRRRSLLVTVAVIGATLCGLYFWRQNLVVTRPLLQIVFDHQDHGAVKCATCHHNFFDDTGRDSCYFCHKIRPELALTIEHDFHTFCRDCHTEIATRGLKSGPTRRCAGCHGE